MFLPYKFQTSSRDCHSEKEVDVMAVFLVPDAKKTSKVDFRRPIESYIGNTYENVQTSDFIGSVRELNTLREGTCERSPDKHDTGLDLILRYYDQLQAIETKLPIAENKVGCSHWSVDAGHRVRQYSHWGLTPVLKIVHHGCGHVIVLAVTSEPYLPVRQLMG